MDDPAKNKPAFRRRVQKLLLAALAGYLLLCLGCAVWQRTLIYVPPHFTPEHVDQAAQSAGLERWRDPAGQAIGMQRRSPVQPATGRVLVVYGNGSWTVGCAHYAEDLQRVAPVDVYLLEYPGYADRAGAPSQTHLFQAAEEALALLPPATNQPLYVLGESLGTGVAAYLAGTHPGQIAGVILLSPFYRLTGVAQHRMPFLPAGLLLVDRFPAEDYLQSYHGPVGILLDGRDDVVPERFGQRLFDGYAGPKRLWRNAEGGHIAPPQPHAKFWREVVEFWRASPAAKN